MSNGKERPIIFISYTEKDLAHAQYLYKELSTAYSSFADVFLAKSHIDDKNRALKPVQDNANKCNVLISLLSPASIKAAWVIFEAGAAWGRDIACIPVYFGGIKASDIPAPFKHYQVRKAFDSQEISDAFSTINSATGIAINVNTKEIASYFNSISQNEYCDIDVGKDDDLNDDRYQECSHKDVNILALKKACANGDAAHWLCVNCKQRLRVEEKNNCMYAYCENPDCPSCKISQPINHYMAYAEEMGTKPFAPKHKEPFFYC